jgi:hypothetical protein
MMMSFHLLFIPSLFNPGMMDKISHDHEVEAWSVVLSVRVAAGKRAGAPNGWKKCQSYFKRRAKKLHGQEWATPKGVPRSTPGDAQVRRLASGSTTYAMSFY